jgi:hypothetical protein
MPNLSVRRELVHVKGEGDSRRLHANTRGNLYKHMWVTIMIYVEILYRNFHCLLFHDVLHCV